jgi:hypothetical protein
MRNYVAKRSRSINGIIRKGIRKFQMCLQTTVCAHYCIKKLDESRNGEGYSLSMYFRYRYLVKYPCIIITHFQIYLHFMLSKAKHLHRYSRPPVERTLRFLPRPILRTLPAKHMSTSKYTHSLSSSKHGIHFLFWPLTRHYALNPQTYLCFLNISVCVVFLTSVLLSRIPPLETSRFPR